MRREWARTAANTPEIRGPISDTRHNLRPAISCVVPASNKTASLGLLLQSLLEPRPRADIFPLQHAAAGGHHPAALIDYLKLGELLKLRLHRHPDGAAVHRRRDFLRPQIEALQCGHRFGAAPGTSRGCPRRAGRHLSTHAFPG